MCVLISKNKTNPNFTDQELYVGYERLYVFMSSTHSLKGYSTQNENSVISYSPSSCCKPVWVSFFCWTQRKIFWRKSGTKRLFRKKVNGAKVPIVLQNIFLCIQQKKEIQVCNNLTVSKWWQNFYFWVEYPFSD